MRWKKVVDRKCSLLFWYFVVAGQKNENALKVLGHRLGYDNFLYLGTEIYYDSDEFDNNQEKLKKILSKDGYGILMNFALNWESIAKEMIRLAKSVNKDLPKKSNKELSDLFLKFYEQNRKLSTSIELLLNIEKILESKIMEILRSKTDSKEIDHYFQVLTSTARTNETEEETRSLLAIGAEIQSKKLTLDNLNKTILNLIDQHIKKYGWINTGRFIQDPYTRKDILDRLETLLIIDCRDKLKELLETEENNTKESKAIMDNLNFNQVERKIIKIAKEYVFLRTLRINTFIKAGFIARPFFNEIAARLDIEYFDLVNLMPDEIVDSLKSKLKISKKEIRERRQCHGCLWTVNDYTFLTGKEVDRYRKKHLPKQEQEEVKSFEGTIAAKGTAKGKAKIVKSILDLDKVNKGDILVAPMTTPDMVPAMERAAAFITDEGGILCHAAIVSREMGKPCIISTNIATTVLKDGDLVEVNADKGIVEIIKKS